jgi:hypothetical protein
MNDGRFPQSQIRNSGVRSLDFDNLFGCRFAAACTP